MNIWIDFFRNNDYMGVKKNIKNGADVDETNDLGEGVLVCALRAGCDIDLLMLLVEAGADIYGFDKEGVSVFDIAITYENIEMLKYILDKGIDVNKTTRKSGLTPLMCAACYGRVDALKILLENGANKDALDAKGLSAIDFARKMNKKTILELLDYDDNAPKNKTYAR